MANGKIRFGKQSGGKLALVIPDGVANTEVIFPESGVLATEDYVDNNSDIGAITSYSQISGTNTIEGSELTNNIHDIFGDGSCIATYQLNGNANDLGGTYNGVETNVTYEEGKFGQAAVFNGSNGNINTTITTNPSVVTFSFNVKFNTLTNGQIILSKRSATGSYGSGFNVFLANGRIEIEENNGVAGTANLISNVNILTDTWYHVVVERNSTSNKIVIDKVNNSIGNSRIFLEASHSLLIGGNFVQGLRYYTAIPLNGSIDQVRIFNRALTEAEINTLYSETIASGSAELNINQGTFIYPKGLASRGYLKSSDTFTGTVPTSGVSDGWKYVAKDENNNFSFYDTKPLLGKTSAELYLKDGKLWSQKAGLPFPDGSTNTNITKITPDMTSNSQDGYIVSASTEYSGTYNACKAFDGIDDGYWWETSLVSTGWLQVKLPTAKVINKYKLLAPKDYTNRAPTSWTIQASDTGAFSGEQITLDTRTGISGWVKSTYKEFYFNNGTPYLYYRIVVTSTGGGQLGIGEMFYTEAQYTSDLDQIEITPISFLSNKVRFASGIPVELAPSGIAKSVTDSFETAVFDLGQTYQNVTASRSAGVTYTNNTGKAIEVLINIIGNNTVFTIDTLTTNTIAANSDYTTITATIPVGSTYKISSGIQKWFELR